MCKSGAVYTREGRTERRRTSAAAAVGESYRSTGEAGVAFEGTQARVGLSVAATDQVGRRGWWAVGATADAVRHAVLVLGTVLAARARHLLARTCMPPRHEQISNNRVTVT